MMMDNLGMGHGMGFMGMIFYMLSWLLILAGIVLLVKWLVTRGKGADEDGETALDILKKRYARGEITKEEFEQRRKDLNQENHGGPA
ncbi:MAG TPA: SHOCT domain-containing protein [Sedimenticola sp.]|nr:SHOCT domain-containing protein [Sedimenticola sp.]